jgi:predicted metal-dependent hydrolase
MIWPPNYNLKVSKKAKYLQLKITQSYQLQVIVPSKYAKKITSQIVSEFIEEKKSWIEKHLAHKPLISTPHQVTLCNGEVFKISYEQAARNAVKCVNDQLIVNSPEPSHNEQLLKRWLKNYAKKLLLPIADNLAQITKFVPAKINVKEQKNLWGNCSSAKIINLNYKLIFLPLHLVQHVILHELAHLKHFNHSTRFWQLLQALDQHALEHDKQLKNANHYVPLWIH